MKDNKQNIKNRQMGYRPATPTVANFRNRLASLRFPCDKDNVCVIPAIYSPRRFRLLRRSVFQSASRKIRAASANHNPRCSHPLDKQIIEQMVHGCMNEYTENSQSQRCRTPVNPVCVGNPPYPAQCYQPKSRNDSSPTRPVSASTFGSCCGHGQVALPTAAAAPADRQSRNCQARRPPTAIIPTSPSYIPVCTRSTTAKILVGHRLVQHIGQPEVCRQIRNTAGEWHQHESGRKLPKRPAKSPTTSKTPTAATKRRLRSARPRPPCRQPLPPRRPGSSLRAVRP